MVMVMMMRQHGYGDDEEEEEKEDAGPLSCHYLSLSLTHLRAATLVGQLFE
jgi:hypothetical protein